MRFSTSGFGMNQFHPKPLSIPLEPFLIFAAQGAPPVPNGKNLQAEKIDTFFCSNSLSGVSSLILFPRVPSNI
jgi:hypothetical protein